MKRLLWVACAVAIVFLLILLMLWCRHPAPLAAGTSGGKEPAPGPASPARQTPPALPDGTTSLLSIRGNPASFFGREVVVQAKVESALYGQGVEECAFTYKVSDGLSEAWVLPLSRTTPAIGKNVRLTATVVGEPDRPWSDDRSDSFYLKEKAWEPAEGPAKP